jgi:hypothetical protein
MHAAFEQDLANVVRRLEDVVADAETVRTPTDWRYPDGAQRAHATDDQMRQALAPSGVDVRINRTGTTDAEGSPLRRWTLFMRPMAPGDPIV